MTAITGTVVFDRRVQGYMLQSMRQVAEMSDQLQAAVTLGIIDTTDDNVSFVVTMHADNMGLIHQLTDLIALYDAGAAPDVVQVAYQKYLDDCARVAVKAAALKGFA